MKIEREKWMNTAACIYSTYYETYFNTVGYIHTASSLFDNHSKLFTEIFLLFLILFQA